MSGSRPRPRSSSLGEFEALSQDPASLPETPDDLPSKELLEDPASSLEKHDDLPSKELLEMPYEEYEDSPSIASLPAEGKSDKWTYEILSMLAGTLLLGALIFIFWYFDHRPLRVWKIPITPNTVISILITCIEGCVAFVLSSAISQLKWIKYKRGPRSLAEMQIFDDASRRSLCGTFMIAIGKGGFPAAFGVIILALTLVLGPFSQQVLQYPILSLPLDHQATVPRAICYTEQESLSGQAALGMKGAIYAALYGFPGNISLKDPSFSCSTGNCTWEPFLSLGVCSDCTDISHLIKASSCNDTTMGCMYSLPSQYQNFSLPQQQKGATLTSVGCLNSTDWGCEAVNLEYNTSEGVVGPKPGPIIELVLLNSTLIGPRGSGKVSVNALDCTLKYCLQSISTTVTNGLFHQSVSQAFPEKNLTFMDNFYNLNTTAWEFLFRWPDIANDFLIGTQASLYVTQFLQILTGGWGTYVDGGTPFSQSDASQAMSAAGNFTELMEFIATSMSNRIRQAPADSSPMWEYVDVNSTETVFGTSYTTEAYFATNWEWLILAAAVVGLTWIFLLYIMYKSRRTGAKLWKSSTLPLLFHGLCDQTRMDLSHCETVDQMEKKAKEIAVQLRDADDGRPSLLSHDVDHTQLLIAKEEKRFSLMSMSKRRISKGPLADSDEV